MATTTTNFPSKVYFHCTMNPISCTEDLRNGLYHHAEVDLPSDNERREKNQQIHDHVPRSPRDRTQACSGPTYTCMNEKLI